MFEGLNAAFAKWLSLYLDRGLSPAQSSEADIWKLSTVVTVALYRIGEMTLHRKSCYSE